MVRVTSKCTCAGSFSVNEILADSRSLSPFGEIVVERSVSPRNGSRLRFRAWMFVICAAVWSSRRGEVASTRGPSTSRMR